MATTYLITGSALYSIAKPDHTKVIPPPNYKTVEVKESYLIEFIVNLRDWMIPIEAALNEDIFVEIQSKASTHLRTIAPLLDPKNPIVDVAVNLSRPSGQIDVWRQFSGYWIHPVTALNVPVGTAIPIAVAPHTGGGWTSASVVADIPLI